MSEATQSPRPFAAAMTERQINRFIFRQALLQRRGFSEPAAEGWADHLHRRDLDHDDRRLCAECRHLKRNWDCRQGGAVVVDLLQRCHLFSWERPN